MSESRTRRVISLDGQEGALVDPTQLESGQPTVALQMENGQKVMVPQGLLSSQADGPYRLGVDLSQVDNSATGTPLQVMVIPVTQEELQVKKRQIDAGGVRVTTHVTTQPRLVDEPGYTEELEINRVPVNQVVDTPPEPYQDGDTLVIPILEEVLVVEKRLVVKEELRISKHRKETRNPQQVTLRRVDASIEQLPPAETL